MFDKEKLIFQSYVSNFDTTDNNIKRKLEHSYRVADLSNQLAIKLNLSEEEIKLASLIGLLHDIGRFYQIEKTNSFIDDKLDHSDYGVLYLFDEGHIRDYIEDDKYDQIIRKAILFHNDYKLPDNLTKKEELFCKIIRDIDKIDIYKAHYDYSECFNNIFDYSEVSEDVINDFYNNTPILINKIKTTSDNIIKILAFILDINFKESYELLEETNNFNKWLENIKIKKGTKEWKKIIDNCNTIIKNRGR